MITSSSLRRRTILAAAMMANLSGIPRVVVAQGQAAFFQVDGVALRGYDPVSYFDGEPRLGSGSIAHNHQGTSWRFATAENRDRFVADPARFLPQYGGYCALGMAHGGAVPTDPLAYTVYRGKLYLNSSKLVRMPWSYARDWMIERAAPNWRAWLERQAVAVAGGRRPVVLHR